MNRFKLLYVVLTGGALVAAGLVFYFLQPYTVSVRLQTGGVYTARDLGTLFESAGGDTVCRAGFANGAQTRGKISQKHLEFTCDPTSAVGAAFEVFDTGRPGEDRYRPEVRSLRDEVVDVAALAVLRDGNWAPFNFEEVERAVDQSQMYVQAVEVIDDRLLTFPHGVGKVLYGEQTVLDYGGSLRNGIYYDGRIFVSHFDTPTMGAWLTYCDWQPPQSVCTNTKKQDWPYWNDVYGMIGWRGHVYLSAGADGSGKGSGVWRIDPESGEMLRVFPKAETFPGEFYGMLVVNDTLIAGHYPSGYLAVISSDGSARFLEVPKALGGSYGMAEGQVEYREAQSLNLYAGRVWVGMYPWGFLWEGDASLENWIRHRLFTWPEVDSGEPAPFHNELDRRYAAMTPEERAVKGAWALPSFWGQRIHSVALSGDENAVLYGLGNMPGLPYDPERDASFGTKEDFKDYGSVRGLRAPNTLIKYIPWPKNGVLDLDFAVSGNRMTLSFEGKTLETVEAHLDVFDLARMKLRSVGSGLYGRSAYEVEAVD